MANRLPAHVCVGADAFNHFVKPLVLLAVKSATPKRSELIPSGSTGASAADVPLACLRERSELGDIRECD